MRLWFGVVLGAALGGCGGLGSAPLQNARDAAYARGDYAQALAYDDGTLSQTAGGGTAPTASAGSVTNDVDFGDISKFLQELRDQRTQDFRKLHEQAIAQSDDPEQQFAIDLAFRANARQAGEIRQADLKPVDDDQIGPDLEKRAGLLWPAVESADAAGEHVKAILLARSFTQYLEPASAFAPKRAALEHAVATSELALVQQTSADTYGARILHQRLARAVGAEVAKDADAEARLAAETGLAWSVAGVDGTCATIDHDLRTRFTTSIGRPVVLAVTFAECREDGVDRASTTQVRPYTETRKVPVPVESWRNNCATHTKLSDFNEVDRFGNVGDRKRESYEDCGAPTKGFYGETELQDRDFEMTEPVTVAHREHIATVGGHIHLEVDGGVREVDFSIRGNSKVGDQYQSAHVGEARFQDGRLADEAYASAGQQLVDQILALGQDAQDARAAEWVAKAAAAGDDAFAVEHAFVLASELHHGTDPAFDAYMSAHRQWPFDALAAALQGAELPVRDRTGVYDVKIPALTKADLDAIFQEMVRKGGAARGFNSALFLSFVVGGASTRETIGTHDPGVLGAIELAYAKGAGHLASGKGMRLTAGKSGGKTLVNFDFNVAYGFRTGAFVLTPIVGVGGDFTTGSDHGMDAPGDFDLPPGFFVEYGLRAGYAFPVVPFTVDAMYTKVLRTAGALSCEKSGELRFKSKKPSLLLNLMGPTVSVRYTEYLADIDGVFKLFGPEGRTAKSWWVMGGLAF